MKTTRANAALLSIVMLLSATSRTQAFSFSDIRNSATQGNILKSAGLLLFIHSLYCYNFRYPTSQPDPYTLKEIFTGILSGKKDSLDRLKCLYYDKIAGHKGRVGSPKEDKVTGLMELPCVEGRGVYDMIEVRANALAKAITVAAAVTWFRNEIAQGWNEYCNGFDSLMQHLSNVLPRR